MAVRLEDYREVAPAGTVDFLYRLSEQVKGMSMVNVNSTKYGGGVAEILHRLIPMLNEVGVEARWEVIQGATAYLEGKP